MKLIFSSNSYLKSSKLNLLLLSSFLILSFLTLNCSGTKRFAIENNESTTAESNLIRVLLSEKSNEVQINIDSKIKLSDENKLLAEINPGNKVFIQQSSGRLQLSISDKSFFADTFFLSGSNEYPIIKIDGKQFRGILKIFSFNSQIKVVNQIGLEDYVKGVMTKEMPIGNGNENYEALKAFSICVRTYALLKIFENKSFYDIYPDTRDQVYGGVDAETSLTNEIVDETKGQILSYNGLPAIIFYHSSCGGFTEDVKNVFNNNDLPYLKSVADGDEPFCSIAPKFNWKEEFSEDVFISRLFDAKLIPTKNFKLESVEVKSRFESGRVKELVINLIDDNKNKKTLTLLGNKIRSIIRTADGKSILRSTFFNISIDGNNRVVIVGKGYGHGVGFCQWGAIGQSKQGIDYQTILNHYFPGTQIIMYND